MKIIMILLLLAATMTAKAQGGKAVVNVERVSIMYEGEMVKARKLQVHSEIPISLDRAWKNVKSPELLQFVAKGMIKFKATDGEFPKQWELGETIGVKMRLFGFLPFGGTHYLYIDKIDDEAYEISTKEWDKAAKVWNHKVKMKDLGNGKIYYEDAIIIYGGRSTGFITSFAKRFYKHRQKRWKLVAEENRIF